MLLQNDTIRLRSLEPDDLEILYQWENDTTLWQYGDTLAPLSKELLSKYIETYDSNPFAAKQLRLIIELKDSNIQIGIIDLFDIDIFHSRTSIGILIAEKYRRQGYGTDALKIIEKYVSHRLGLMQIVANIQISNSASTTLFSKNGYRQTGCLKNWHRCGNSFEDVIVMQKVL